MTTRTRAQVRLAAPAPAGPYRDDIAGVRARRRELWRQRACEAAAIPSAIRTTTIRREARITTGTVAATAGAITLLLAVHPAAAGWLEPLVPGPRPAVIATALLAGWIAVAIAHFASRSRAAARYDRALTAALATSSDARRDVDRLERISPDQVARALGARHERASILAPTLGLSWLLPITSVYGLLAFGTPGIPDPGRFEALAVWLAPALLPAYLAVGALSWWLAARLTRATTPELARPLLVSRAAHLAVVSFALLAASGWLAAMPVAAALSSAAAGAGVAAFAWLAVTAAGAVRRERLALRVRTLNPAAPRSSTP